MFQSDHCLHSLYYVSCLNGVKSGAHRSEMFKRKEPTAQAMHLHMEVVQLLDVEALDGLLWTQGMYGGVPVLATSIYNFLEDPPKM